MLSPEHRLVASQRLSKEKERRSLGDFPSRPQQHCKIIDDLECVWVLGPEHPDVADSHYNIACSQSLAGDIEQALASVEAAFRAGFQDKDHIESDSDLDNIRDHERFRCLLAQLKQHDSNVWPQPLVPDSAGRL